MLDQAFYMMSVEYSLLYNAKILGTLLDEIHSKGFTLLDIMFRRSHLALPTIELSLCSQPLVDAGTQLQLG